MTQEGRTVGVFHPGTQHSWQTARALDESGFLRWYATSIFWIPSRFPYSLVSMLPRNFRGRVEAELRRFHHPALNPAVVRTVDGMEWLMRLAARLRMYRLRRWIHARENAAFATPVRHLMVREPVSTVWGYDLSSLETFRNAQRIGSKRILDRTIGHPAVYNKVMEEVFSQYPEFFRSPSYRIDAATIDRADQEHELADKILVGSPFCAATLFDGQVPRMEPGKVEIVPYCYDDHFFSASPRPPRSDRNVPLRFLFTGLAGPRKGIHLVLKVFARIPSSAASLTIVGDVQVPPATFARYADRVKVYPTVPRADVARHMSAADCLVFPSYFEGAGLVLYEALALGLGVIQSKNASVVLPADSPFLMTTLTESELYRCVMTAIENRALLDSQREKNRLAAQHFNYQSYKARVKQVIAHV